LVIIKIYYVSKKTGRMLLHSSRNGYILFLENKMLYLNANL
jgi:hypothetical protein